MNKSYAPVFNTSRLWKNMWTTLWDSMWENCGKLLWKTLGGILVCVKVGFSTRLGGKRGKVFAMIYTGFNRYKWRFYTFST